MPRERVQRSGGRGRRKEHGGTEEPEKEPPERDGGNKNRTCTVPPAANKPCGIAWVALNGTDRGLSQRRHF